MIVEVKAYLDGPRSEADKLLAKALEQAHTYALQMQAAYAHARNAAYLLQHVFWTMQLVVLPKHFLPIPVVASHRIRPAAATPMPLRGVEDAPPINEGTVDAAVRALGHGKAFTQMRRALSATIKLAFAIARRLEEHANEVALRDVALSVRARVVGVFGPRHPCVPLLSRHVSAHSTPTRPVRRPTHAAPRPPPL